MKADSLQSKSVLKRFIDVEYLSEIVEFDVSVSSDVIELPLATKWSKNESKFIEIPILLKTDIPGRYPATIILRGQGQSILDTRLIQLEVILTGRSSKKELKLECPVRERLFQNIPIMNKTPHFWRMVSYFEPDYIEKSKNIFFGPESFEVAPGYCSN